jgi:hypothetical protein
VGFGVDKSPETSSLVGDVQLDPGSGDNGRASGSRLEHDRSPQEALGSGHEDLHRGALRGEKTSGDAIIRGMAKGEEGKT